MQCDGQAAKLLFPVDSMNATFPNLTENESEYKYNVIDEIDGEWIVLYVSIIVLNTNYIK